MTTPATTGSSPAPQVGTEPTLELPAEYAEITDVPAPADTATGPVGTPASGPMGSEPAITVGSIGAVVAALITCAVAFGLPITDEQQTAVLGAVAVLAPIVVGVITRGHVSPSDRKPTHRA